MTNNGHGFCVWPTIGNLATLAGALLFVASVSALAQQPAKPVRIGLLHFGAPSPNLPAFMEGLREFGYVDGSNLVLEHRDAGSRPDRLKAAADELVQLRPDIVVVAGHTPSMQAAKAATQSIPIVVVAAGDPVGSGLVVSLARPGGNVTGLTMLSPDLAAKRLELLKEINPGLARVAVVWNPSNPAKLAEWRETQSAARTFGLKLQSLQVRVPEDFDPAFSAARKDRADALIAFSDRLVNAHGTRVAAFANENRMVSMYTLAQFVEAGGLIAYGPNLPDMYRRAAGYVDRILKGAKPADLPVEQPTKFELVVNLKTAKMLGITVPRSLLLRADRVIE
jgi:putative ABC transport system substrate-binding protein